MAIVDQPFHRQNSTAALTAVSEAFAKRLDHMKQCPKFSDVWPIENIWGIIKERVAKKKCENLNQLKREITRVWRDLDAYKSLHARLMKSIPVRCRAVVENHGAQIV